MGGGQSLPAWWDGGEGAVNQSCSIYSPRQCNIWAVQQLDIVYSLTYLQITHLNDDEE